MRQLREQHEHEVDAGWHGGTWFVWNLVMSTLSAATIISQPRVEVIFQ